MGSSGINASTWGVQSFVERKSFHNKLAQIGICFSIQNKRRIQF